MAPSPLPGKARLCWRLGKLGLKDLFFLFEKGSAIVLKNFSK